LLESAPTWPQKEELLMHSLSVIGILYQFDGIWYNIYGSQLEALNDLNGHSPIKRQALQQQHYTKALFIRCVARVDEGKDFN
jgi:hypothetical protein